MFYTLLGVLLVVLDQITKFWAKGALAHGKTIDFIPYIMDFAYVENRGAAFGILQDTRWLLIGMTVVVLGVILFYALKTKKRHPMFLLSVALIFAGGVGNLIDRLFFGYVTDFLHVLFVEFPCFNLADVCVCVGGALLVIFLLFLDKPQPDKRQVESDE
jgi:signal peptidase II